MSSVLGCFFSLSSYLTENGTFSVIETRYDEVS